MPKSRVRRKKDAPVVVTAPVKVRRKQSPRWMGPLIIALWAIGAIYLIAAYFTNFYEGVPTMEDLGNWHIAIGFSFIAAGFGAATQWH